MRALYSFPDRIGAAGIGNTAYWQATSIAAQGVELELCCTSVDRDVPGARAVVRTLTLAGRRIPHRVLGIHRSFRYHDGRAAALLERHASSIDVVHCWPGATVKTCEQARSLGIPTLREVPNTHTAHAFEVVAKELAALGLAAVPGHSHTFSAEVLAQEEREYQLADLLLVPSEYSRQTFLDRGYPAEKLVLHRYGYDPTRFSPAGGRASRRFTALFIGRCEPRKGLHHALAAWLQSGAAENGRFVVCGAFVPGYREAIAHFLEHPSVEVRGFTSDPAAVMRQADVLVLPSVEEGSAVVTYEARACGCVLLVSDAAGARCTHLREGLVHEAGDVGELTEHLRLLSRDADLLARLRAASLAGAAALTWSAAGAELADVYRRAGAQAGRAVQPTP